MVDELKLKVSVESLRNEMEIRFELGLKEFQDKIKNQMNEFMTKDEMTNRLYEKLHKKEFELHFDKLNSTCSYLEMRVTNAIPAMKHDLQTSLKSKAEQRELDQMKNDFASKDFVLNIVSRLNKLEESLIAKGKIGRQSSRSGSGSRSGSRSSRSGSLSSLQEDENEDDEDGDDRRYRKRNKDKQSKESPKGKGGKENGLDQIKEEEEKEASIKSMS